MESHIHQGNSARCHTLPRIEATHLLAPDYTSFGAQSWNTVAMARVVTDDGDDDDIQLHACRTPRSVKPMTRVRTRQPRDRPGWPLGISFLYVYVLRSSLGSTM